MSNQIEIPKIIGEWKIVKVLGNGGMGIVLLGTHQRSGKQAAIKLMLPQALASSSAHKRFIKEIQALKEISSPFVASLLDYDDDQRFPWYALEFVSDFSLRDTMKMHGKFADQAWWDLAKGALRALEAIHSAGVIHRDIKPDNIMMSKKGPKIIDFGLAKSFSSSLHSTQTRLQDVFGTFAYMPPEQHDGMFKTSEKSDIYSMGITLIEAAGMKLDEIWQGESDEEIIAKKRSQMPNLTKLNDVQKKLIMAMIQSNPEDRLSAPRLLVLMEKLLNNNIEEEAKKIRNKNGFLNKLDNWADRMEQRADEQKEKANEKKKLKAEKNQVLIGTPAKNVDPKPSAQIWPDQEFPMAMPRDRVIAYLIDIPLFFISLGLIQIWFLFKSRGQLTPGRKFKKLLIIDSKTKKPVSGKRVLFRGVVLQYAVFTSIPFVSTTEENGWYVFVSPLLISLLMFLPARKNLWDYLTQTTVGKYQ